MGTVLAGAVDGVSPFVGISPVVVYSAAFPAYPHTHRHTHTHTPASVYLGGKWYGMPGRNVLRWSFSSGGVCKITRAIFLVEVT